MSVKFDFSRLDKPFEAEWPVSIPIPQDGGKVAKEELTVRFRLLSKEEVEQVDSANDGGRSLVRTAMVSLGKSEPALTPDLLEQLLETSYVRLAITQAYFNFSAGVPAKN